MSSFVLLAGFATLASNTKITDDPDVEERFKLANQLFLKRYSPHGRTIAIEDPRAVSLEFELETRRWLKMNPQVLLLRGCIELTDTRATTAVTHPGLILSTHEEFRLPHVSRWFQVDIDGGGEYMPSTETYYQPLGGYMARSRGSYYQTLSAQIEFQSATVRPRVVLESAFLNHFKQLLEATSSKKSQTLFGRHWLKGTSHRMRLAEESCRNCDTQFTVGLTLGRVPELLSQTRQLQGAMKRVATVCDRRSASGSGCTDDYRGLIALAASVLMSTQHCHACTNPKRCVDPWLVRTHFGDTLRWVRAGMGDLSLEGLAQDIREVSQMNLSSPLFPFGVQDYLRLPEMAETAGLVQGRLPPMEPEGVLPRALPLTPEAWVELGNEMIKSKDRVHRALRNHACHIHGRVNWSDTRFTGMQWLEEMVSGRDLMSDADSPISQGSFSHLVWKSMGSWRMAGDGRVYVECRSPATCFDDLGNSNGQRDLMRRVAERMVAFEEQ